MFLSVKGTVEDAKAEFAKRGIVGARLTSNSGKWYATEWTVEGTPEHRHKAVDWFCETPMDAPAPYPVGTLLYHD